jgi:hypothetical protein
VSKESRRAARNAARAASAPAGAGQRPSTGQRPASTGPSGTPRAGRRERPRRFEERPFLERYRGLLIGAVVVAVAVVAAGLVFAGATQAAYSCSLEWEPTPTASPAAGATPRLGYAQDNMGNSHQVTKPQTYVFCPPASGNHFNVVGQGPIKPRVFGPNDSVTPMNWIHNLEHGGLVVLYRGDSDGATPAGQDRFKQFFESFPPGPICNTPPGSLSPVIARFDQMKWPFAALVWGRVLPLEQWDPDEVLQFYATESVRLDANGDYVTPPEPQAAGCPAPSHSPAPSAEPSDSAAPSGSIEPSAVPDSSGSAAPSPASS